MKPSALQPRDINSSTLPPKNPFLKRAPQPLQYSRPNNTNSISDKPNNLPPSNQPLNRLSTPQSASISASSQGAGTYLPRSSRRTYSPAAAANTSTVSRSLDNSSNRGSSRDKDPEKIQQFSQTKKTNQVASQSNSNLPSSQFRKKPQASVQLPYGSLKVAISIPQGSISTTNSRGQQPSVNFKISKNQFLQRTNKQIRNDSLSNSPLPQQKSNGQSNSDVQQQQQSLSNTMTQTFAAPSLMELSLRASPELQQTEQLPSGYSFDLADQNYTENNINNNNNRVSSSSQHFSQSTSNSNIPSPSKSKNNNSNSLLPSSSQGIRTRTLRGATAKGYLGNNNINPLRVSHDSIELPKKEIFRMNLIAKKHNWREVVKTAIQGKQMSEIYLIFSDIIVEIYDGLIFNSQAKHLRILDLNFKDNKYFNDDSLLFLSAIKLPNLQQVRVNVQNTACSRLKANLLLFDLSYVPNVELHLGENHSHQTILYAQDTKYITVDLSYEVSVNKSEILSLSDQIFRAQHSHLILCMNGLQMLTNDLLQLLGRCLQDLTHLKIQFKNCKLQLCHLKSFFEGLAFPPILDTEDDASRPISYYIKNQKLTGIDPAGAGTVATEKSNSQKTFNLHNQVLKQQHQQQASLVLQQQLQLHQQLSRQIPTEGSQPETNNLNNILQYLSIDWRGCTEEITESFLVNLNKLSALTDCSLIIDEGYLKKNDLKENQDNKTTSSQARRQCASLGQNHQMMGAFKDTSNQQNYNDNRNQFKTKQQQQQQSKQAGLATASNINLTNKSAVPVESFSQPLENGIPWQVRAVKLCQALKKKQDLKSFSIYGKDDQCFVNLKASESSQDATLSVDVSHCNVSPFSLIDVLKALELGGKNIKELSLNLEGNWQLQYQHIEKIVKAIQNLESLTKVSLNVHSVFLYEVELIAIWLQLLKKETIEVQFYHDFKHQQLLTFDRFNKQIQLRFIGNFQKSKINTPQNIHTICQALRELEDRQKITGMEIDCKYNVMFRGQWLEELMNTLSVFTQLKELTLDMSFCNLKGSYAEHLKNLFEQLPVSISSIKILLKANPALDSACAHNLLKQIPKSLVQLQLLQDFTLETDLLQINLIAGVSQQQSQQQPPQSGRQNRAIVQKTQIFNVTHLLPEGKTTTTANHKNNKIAKQDSVVEDNLVRSGQPQQQHHQPLHLRQQIPRDELKQCQNAYIQWLISQSDENFKEEGEYRLNALNRLIEKQKPIINGQVSNQLVCLHLKHGSLSQTEKIKQLSVQYGLDSNVGFTYISPQSSLFTQTYNSVLASKLSMLLFYKIAADVQHFSPHVIFADLLY